MTGYIEQVVLSPKSPIVKYVPTLPVIIYSIKNILHPTLATRSSSFSELLDLLATVEFYRGRTLDHARDALTWNDYYTTNPPSILLTDEETAFLKKLESDMADLRPIYITILTMCCHLDMYLLWTANPPSITDFLIRFNEYFPFLNKSYDNHSPRLFHFNLTDEETAQLFDTGIKCCDFVDEEMEAQAHGQSKRSENPMHDPADLVALIDYYLEETMSAAQVVKDMFNNKDPKTL